MHSFPHIIQFIQRVLDSHDTDPVTLPNGLPLNCLLYADDLVLISRSAAVFRIKLTSSINTVRNGS